MLQQALAHRQADLHQNGMMAKVQEQGCQLSMTMAAHWQLLVCPFLMLSMVL